jgi:hypothetical protein
MVTLDGVHCVKHAIRFGAEIELLLTIDPAAALRLRTRWRRTSPTGLRRRYRSTEGFRDGCPACGRAASWSASPAGRPPASR